MNPPSKKIDDMVQILGVRIISTSISEVLEKIDQIVHSSLKKSPYFITTIGPEFIVIAQQDPEFARVINACDLPLPDGVGLKLAKPDLQIIPGRKLVSELTNKNYRTFFLGGRALVAAKMAKKYGGESDPGESNIKTPSRNAEIVAKINSYAPDILFVAYGAPYQEKWLWENRSALKAKIMVGVGGAFDYLTGQAKLPPGWLSAIGFEWLWRLVLEPWRWKRQLRLVQFAFLLLAQRLGLGN